MLKNVIHAVKSEGNLNQIGSLRRKIEIIGNGHVDISARHTRQVRHIVRVVTSQVEFGLIQTKPELSRFAQTCRDIMSNNYVMQLRSYARLPTDTDCLTYAVH